MEAKRIDHINIKIPENGVEKALNFYRNALGFETEKLKEYNEGKRTSFFLRLSESSVINIRPKEEFQNPSGKNLDHFCIVLDEEIDSIKKKLENREISILRESKPLGSKGRAPAVYIEDPFGYKIELKSSENTL